MFKRAPVSHAERAPVSRARTCACMHESFFFFPLSLPKKITSTQKCVKTSPRVSRRTSPPPCLVHVRVRCHACTNFFLFILRAKKKNNLPTKVCSNEPPCLTQNEPPCLVLTYCVHACMHAHTHESFFFRPSKKTIANKSVFKRAPVSHV